MRWPMANRGRHRFAGGNSLVLGLDNSSGNFRGEIRIAHHACGQENLCSSGFETLLDTIGQRCNQFFMVRIVPKRSRLSSAVTDVRSMT
jgi:hypothetical protein